MIERKPQKKASGLEQIIEDMHTFFKHVETKKYDPKYAHDAERKFVLHYRYNIAQFYNMIERQYKRKRDVEDLDKCYFNKDLKKVYKR